MEDVNRLFHPSFQPDVSPRQPRLKNLSSLPKNKTPEYLRCGFSPVSRCASLCLRCCHVSSGGPLSVHMFILQSLWQRLRINTWEGDGLHVLRILLISFHRRHSSLAEERRASESEEKKKHLLLGCASNAADKNWFPARIRRTNSALRVSKYQRDADILPP